MSDNLEAVLITISGLDRVGVVSEVSGYLFETGANLADTAFAVLGQGFEYSAIAEFDDGASVEDVQTGLEELESLIGADISVKPFPFGLKRDASGKITHFVEISGGDKPGLVARISEVLQNYEANIVRMTSRRASGEEYRTRFSINVADDRAAQLENALFNTTGSLRLTCEIRKT